MILEFIDGPLKGYIHEVAAELPVPDSVGIPQGLNLYWYRRIAHAKAVYMGTEPITDDRTQEARDC